MTNTNKRLRIGRLKKEFLENKGRIVAIRYENQAKTKNRDLNPRWVVGEIGELEKDLYGYYVYIKATNRNIADVLIKYEGRIVVLGRERVRNYCERYYLKTITNLELIY